ncbi:hypothetical protein HRbin30_03110 [bacterium HR30]|nr:hypothetical protein HRbin30_03110 [bacterium HR30]
MEFSEGRKSFLAHKILEMPEKEGLAQIRNHRLALNEIKRVLEQDHKIDEQIDALVRRKIASLSRRVIPGSREWEVLYRQYYEEELRKRRR